MFGNEKNELLLLHTVLGTQAHAQETEKELEVEASLATRQVSGSCGLRIKRPYFRNNRKPE